MGDEGSRVDAPTKREPVRIICFHGSGGNATEFAQYIQPLTQPMEEMGIARFYFPEGTFNFHSQQILPADIPIKCSVRTWYNVHKSPINTSKMYNASAKCTAAVQVRRMEGVEQSLNSLMEFTAKHGPFNAVLGFSQGTVMASLFALEIKKRTPHAPITNFILFAPRLPVDQLYTDQIIREAPYLKRTKSLHSVGSNDRMIKSAVSAKLIEVFANEEILKVSSDHVVHEHSGGHEVPPTCVNDFHAFVMREYENR